VIMVMVMVYQEITVVEEKRKIKIKKEFSPILYVDFLYLLLRSSLSR
jgi:hypothetical protein